jgi:hypothetical protein
MGLFRKGKDDPVPGHVVGARVEWTEGGSAFHAGTVLKVARTHAVKVRWDDHHPGDREGWHVLGDDVYHAPNA